MATSPAERQEVLTDLSTLAIRDLVAVWRRSSRVDVEFAELITAAFPEIATAYAGTAAELSAQWFLESAPAPAFTPAVAVPNVEALASSAQWALGAEGEVALDRMSGSIQRAVFDGARETTLINVAREPGAKWARYASANACPWCRMMATRRAVYLSSETALKSHDSCHCVAVEVRPGGSYDLPDYVEKWEDEYAQARDLAGSGDPKAIQAAWRRLLADA